MTPNVLLAREHIYDFVEAEQTRFQRAYEALSDEDAMDEAVVQKLSHNSRLKYQFCKDRLNAASRFLGPRAN